MGFILAALLSGMMVVGVSPAFAEEPQPTAQEVLKAWGQAQMEVEQFSKATTLERTHGLKPLTAEELQQIVGGTTLPPTFSSMALGHMPGAAQLHALLHYPGGS